MAGHGLDEVFASTDGCPLSRRRVHLLTIQEYARHDGHADLLRERTGGVTAAPTRTSRSHTPSTAVRNRRRTVPGSRSPTSATTTTTVPYRRPCHASASSASGEGRGPDGVANGMCATTGRRGRGPCGCAAGPRPRNVVPAVGPGRLRTRPLVSPAEAELSGPERDRPLRASGAATSGPQERRRPYFQHCYAQ
ncbi:DUF664 domain-containing protein [Streptomyces sp. NPDC060035]|uniref:mycothiol transferase n=1 Tax=Streptomyces sp. NPDC060035 TaxID=3347044 RepID=UPI003690108C